MQQTTERGLAGPALPRPGAGAIASGIAGHRASSPLTLLAACAFAVILGFSRLSYGLLLPAVRADLHGSFALYGLVGSANLAGYLVGTLLVPPVLAHYRDRGRLNAVSLLAMSLAMVGSAASADVVQLGGWRFLVGVWSAFATVLTISLTLERIAAAERGRASGLIWMGGAAGIVVSGLVAPLVIGAGVSPAWRWVWAAMGLLGVVATWGFGRSLRMSAGTAVAADGVSRPPSAWSVAASLLKPRGLLPFALAYFAFGCGYIIYATFFIALVVHQGVPALLAGLVWSVIGVAGMAGGVVWGRVADRWPGGFVLAAALGVGALGTLGVQGPAWEAAGAVLTGTAFIGVPTIVTALLQRAVPRPSYTASLSLLTSILAVGQVAGPLLGGAVTDRYGLTAGTVLASPILAIGALLAATYGVTQCRH